MIVGTVSRPKRDILEQCNGNVEKNNGLRPKLGEGSLQQCLKERILRTRQTGAYQIAMRRTHCSEKIFVSAVVQTIEQISQTVSFFDCTQNLR
jgi:hypothetical protein